MSGSTITNTPQPRDVQRRGRTGALSIIAAVFVACLAAFASACGGSDPPTTTPAPPMPFQIDIPSDETSVKPNESRLVVFGLRDAMGQPLPGRTLQLLIVDGANARGATLSLDRGVTNASGEVPVQIIGGQPTTFTIRASALGAPDRELRVKVTAQDSGPVAVNPELIGAGAFLGINVATIRIALLENQGCAAIPRATPLPAQVPARLTTPGKEVVFGAVSVAGGHAVFGQGFDAAGTLMVEGCVDLSGGSILAETTIHVILPLLPIVPTAAGRYSSQSQLRFTPEVPAPLRAVRAAWHDLDACDLDPGRLWLDCTVDALGVTPPGGTTDPLDCVPTAADEAAFDGKLAARRGLTVPTSKNGRCRQDFDGAGHGSLEKQITAMFAQSPKLIADVEAIATEADKLLENFRIQSAIEVSPTSQPDRLQVSHRLVALDIGVGNDAIVELPRLGLPVPIARFIPAEATRSDITIDRHGFTLRLGAATKAAFLRAALERRGYSSDPTKFVAALFGAASYADRGVTHKGCPALAALVCPLVGAPAGCVVDACEKGLVALGASLDAVFSRLDGDELDFFLQGSAPLIDRDADGRADGIGWILPMPGVWKAVLRIKDEQFAVSGIFAADRQP